MVDLNECDARDKAGCQHMCVNNQGSFICRCKHGYELGHDKKSCNSKLYCITTLSSCCNDLTNILVEIRIGCEVSNGGCAHMCRDTDTDVECSCQPGYQLASDGKQCTGTVCYCTMLYQRRFCLLLYFYLFCDRLLRLLYNFSTSFFFFHRLSQM